MSRIGAANGITKLALRGKSTRNTRIERFWNDSNRTVITRFKSIFQCLEQQEVITFGGIHWDLQLSVLVKIFLPRVQKALLDFSQWWNYHVVRTEGSSPNKLWLDGFRLRGLLPAPLPDHEVHDIVLRLR